MEFRATAWPEPPSINIRWLRPTASTALLQLPTTPVTLISADTYVALSPEESEQCEEAWKSLSEEEQAVALELSWSSANKVQNVAEDFENEDETVGVTIFDDRLFEIDVRTMEVSQPLFATSHVTSYPKAQLKPIYWRQSGPKIHVRRATWMYDEVQLFDC